MQSARGHSRRRSCAALVVIPPRASRPQDLRQFVGEPQRADSPDGQAQDDPAEPGQGSKSATAIVPTTWPAMTTSIDSPSPRTVGVAYAPPTGVE